ncbi:MAG: hypothetical protein OXB88_01425 [Bacteriovoracales bacterium]|nr:hypothetical protein [Bacteriovoracales bacterium]
MKNLTLIFILSCLTTTFAQGRGTSSYPSKIRQKYVSAELTGVLSGGSEVGLQARYFERLRSDLSFSAGFGFSSGDRANSIFASADYELYPDYKMQPRISLEASLERSLEFGDSHLKAGVAPVVSKGFSFWGKEVFPFIGIPVTLDLNSDDKSYDLATQLAFGAAAQLSPHKGLLANIEINIDIDNSYSGVFLGISHPLK